MNYLEKILALDWPYIADNSDESLQLIDFLNITKGSLQYTLILRDRLTGQHPATLIEEDLSEGEIIEINGQYIRTGGNSDLLKIAEDLHEVATIAAIIGDHITDDLYEYLNDSGYITTVELIGTWAVEFFTKFQSVTEWCDEVFDNPGRWDLSNDVCCWDDCVIEFASQKFNDYRK
jgi:hypothetical protein